MKVLVVEDDRSLGTVLTAGLKSEGFNVRLERDGEDGLWAATEGEHDVVVLDIMLPRRNGYDVLREMRRRQIWTPVLMLTAKDGAYDQVDAFDLGADDYLTKPFDFVVLVARLRALARRAGAERPVLLEVGDLCLDPARHRVSRAGTDIRLTAKEYALLEFLMRRAGAPVTKVQILDGVWDQAFAGDLNIVEVYVGYLRKKIDAPFGRHSLETLRGVGYRLVDDSS